MLDGPVSLLDDYKTFCFFFIIFYFSCGRLAFNFVEKIREIGMNSTELLKLIEDCPKGSETLITRIIHILTDKSSKNFFDFKYQLDLNLSRIPNCIVSDQPSQVLIDKVRDLYVKRISDVRFLIPVLNYLSKVWLSDSFEQIIIISQLRFYNFRFIFSEGDTGSLATSYQAIANRC